MTWDIVVGIIALIGVFGTVGTWTIKIGKTLATLESTITALKDTIKSLRDDTKEDIKSVDSRLTDDEKRIENHESRIIKLECVRMNNGIQNTN